MSLIPSTYHTGFSSEHDTELPITPIILGLILINPIILDLKVNMDEWQIKLNMMGMEDGDAQIHVPMDISIARRQASSLRLALIYLGLPGLPSRTSTSADAAGYHYCTPQ